MKIIENVKSHLSQELGFYSITIGDLEIQACLKAGKRKDFIKVIDANDCGAFDGICRDVNDLAFKKFGPDRCIDLLYRHARLNGVRVINN